MLPPLHVTTHGSGEKIALLIHGMAGSSATWNDLAIFLVNHGYTCIAPDLRGHGKSSIADKYSIDEWVQDIIDLGVKPDLLIGHSIGGLIASKLQSHYNPQQTILLDPVFRLPSSLIALKVIHKIFKKNMTDRINFLKRDNQSQNNDELDMLVSWDQKSIEALKLDKLAVKGTLLGTYETLLIRAKKSYIVPRKLSKIASQNIHLWQFQSSHDIHRDSFESLSNVIRDFISIKSPSILI